MFFWISAGMFFSALNGPPGASRTMKKVRVTPDGTARGVVSKSPFYDERETSGNGVRME